MSALEVLSQIWLSRFAALAALVYAYCAFRSLRLNPSGKSNRISFVLNLIFTAWAVGAVFWYSAGDRDTATALYRLFSWTWCAFPPFLFHFLLRLTRSPFISTPRWRRTKRVLMYAPAVALAAIVPLYVIDDSVYRAGYWMLGVKEGPAYFIFVAHYIGYVAATCVVTLQALRRSKNESERARLRSLGIAMLVALPCGILTDTVFLLMGLDFPNLAIFWALILEFNALSAMGRWDLLSSFPLAEAPRIMRSLGDFVLYFDDKGKLEWANESALAAVGAADPEEAWGSDIVAFVGLAGTAGFLRALETKLPVEIGTVRFGPAAIPVTLEMHPVFELARPRGVAVVACDRRAEEARRLAEGKLAETDLLLDQFMRHSLDGIIVTDGSGAITRWNPSMEAITGTRAEQALGRTLREVYDELVTESDRLARWSDDLGRLARGAASGSFSSAYEHCITRRDGERRFLQSSFFSLPAAQSGESMLALIVRDVTEQKRLAEEQIERIKRLDQAQKMDAVGTLTSGIAHDFNNTLAGIVGAISLIKMSLEAGAYRKPEDLRGELDIMSRAADRATQSVKRLRSLTKKRPPESKPIRLDGIVRQVEEYLRPSLDERVSLTIEELPESFIHGDPGQIEQLVLNLLINAEHSMTVMRKREERQGGAITVGLRRERPSSELLAEHPEAMDRDYFALAISDEGVGIPKANLDRIFEPFYTTKRSQNATGLGLATVHSILRQHGGFIRVMTAEGKGSTFLAYLPAETRVAEPAAAEGPIALGKSGDILVADDDEIPRRSAIAMLKAIGFGAEACASGEEALARCRDEPSRWKAVLLDYRMTGLRGDETARAMREIRPGLPVVIATGYAPEEAMEAIGESYVLLAKPYKLESLAAAMDAAIGKAKARE